jgi:hypothetical protein
MANYDFDVEEIDVRITTDNLLGELGSSNPS